MTANRDLKRWARDRQARTGESYVTALRQVLAARREEPPSRIPTVELVDVTGVAASLGLKCRAAMSPALAETIDVRATLRRFREILTTTWRDPALALLQAVALRGEHVQVPLVSSQISVITLDLEHAWCLAPVFDRARGGICGINDSGRRLAVPVVPRAGATEAAPAGEAATAVFAPWLLPVGSRSAPPLISVRSLAELIAEQALERRS